MLRYFKGIYIPSLKNSEPLDGQLRKPEKTTLDFFRYFNKNLFFSVKFIKLPFTPVIYINEFACKRRQKIKKPQIFIIAFNFAILFIRSVLTMFDTVTNFPHIDTTDISAYALELNARITCVAKIWVFVLTV